MEKGGVAPLTAIAIAIGGSILGGAGIQLAAALVWGGAVMARLEQLDLKQKDIINSLKTLEEQGYRGIPLIQQQIMDSRERTDRIIRALDNAWNEVQLEKQKTVIMDERIKNQGERLSTIERNNTNLLQQLYKLTPPP